MTFINAYEDTAFAEAYSQITFRNTYYLAYRDLPEIIRSHVRGDRALDFGCGAGRSTRFVADLGFNTTGIDISEAMIAKAHEMDPQGDYRQIEDGDFSELGDNSFDLVTSIFTFDNIPTFENKVRLFIGLSRLLKPEGRLLSLVSTPEMYTHEWASFSTRDYLENRKACCGGIVKIVNTDSGNPTAVDDILWPDENYREVYGQAGLEIDGLYKPLGKEVEPFEWVNEERIAPWVIYVLRRKA